MIHVLLTAVGLVVLIAPAVLVSNRLRLDAFSAAVLAVALLAWAELIVVLEVLSFAHAFRAPWLILTEVGVLAATAIAVARLGFAFRLPRPRLAELRLRLRGLPPDYKTLIGVVAVAGAVNFFLGWSVAPNTPDSMTYHLSRAAYWAQQSSVFHFAGAGARQASMPPNGEFWFAYLLTLMRSDAIVQLVQWLSWLLAMTAVYQLALVLELPRRAALLAALLFACLPQPLLQSSSTQTDLLATVPILSTLVFGLRAVRAGSRADSLLAAIAAGIAVGTKSSALIALPLIALIVAFAAWRRSRPGLLVRLWLTSVAAVILLGSINYLQNYRDFGDFTAPKSFKENGAGGPGSVRPVKGEELRNVVRMTWSSFVETAPLHPTAVVGPISGRLQRLAPSFTTRGKADRPPALTFAFDVGHEIDEDKSGYGLLGLLVLIPCWALALVQGPPLRRAVALGGASCVVLLAFALRYSVVNGRILLPFVAMVAPFMGLIAARTWARVAATSLAAITVLTALAVNPSKPVLPLVGQSAVALDRREQQGLRAPEIAQALAKLDTLVSSEAPLGVRVGEDGYDYPLFGAHLERELHRVVPARDDERRGIVSGKRVAAIYYDRVRPPAGARYVALDSDRRLVFPDRAAAPRGSRGGCQSAECRGGGSSVAVNPHARR